jgi:cytochrome c
MKLAGALLGAMLAANTGTVAAGHTRSGDPKAGAVVYERCLACHALAYNRTGPAHCGLLGRRAGGVADFAYSDAMKRTGWVWDRQTLDRFLTDPLKTVPGTTMGYAGVKDPQERADLIAWLEQTGHSADCRAHPVR